MVSAGIQEIKTAQVLNPMLGLEEDESVFLAGDKYLWRWIHFMWEKRKNVWIVYSALRPLQTFPVHLVQLFLIHVYDDDLLENAKHLPIR